MLDPDAQQPVRWYARKIVWIPAAFFAFVIVVSIVSSDSDPPSTTSVPADTSGSEYVGGASGCLHGYNVIGDWQYLTQDQRIEKLQEVRNNTKFAEPVIATPAAEMVRAYINSEAFAWEQAGPTSFTPAPIRAT